MYNRKLHLSFRKMLQQVKMIYFEEHPVGRDDTHFFSDEKRIIVYNLQESNVRRWWALLSNLFFRLFSFAPEQGKYSVEDASHVRIPPGLKGSRVFRVP